MWRRKKLKREDNEEREEAEKHETREEKMKRLTRREMMQVRGGEADLWEGKVGRVITGAGSEAGWQVVAHTQTNTKIFPQMQPKVMETGVHIWLPFYTVMYYS